MRDLLLHFPSHCLDDALSDLCLCSPRNHSSERSLHVEFSPSINQTFLSHRHALICFSGDCSSIVSEDFVVR